jgi:hypothetical protein
MLPFSVRNNKINVMMIPIELPIPKPNEGLQGHLQLLRTSLTNEKSRMIPNTRRSTKKITNAPRPGKLISDIFEGFG